MAVWVTGARSADGLRLSNVSDVFTPDASKGMVRPAERESDRAWEG